MLPRPRPPFCLFQFNKSWPIYATNARRPDRAPSTESPSHCDSELGQRLGEGDEEDCDDDGVENDFAAEESLEPLSRSSTGTRDERPIWRRISERRRCCERIRIVYVTNITT